MALKRAVQLFVLFGIPLLGALYVYNFIGRETDNETPIIPFKPFKVPKDTKWIPAPLIPTAGARTGISPVIFELRDPITVVNYWATWCPPCVEEFPALLELSRQLEGLGVRFVFVSVDEQWESVLHFMEENRVRVKKENLFWDPSKSEALRWGSTKFPETYVLRKDAWIVEKIIGLQQWTRPAVVKYFSDLALKNMN